MEFSNSLRAEKYLSELRNFMEQKILPSESIYHQQRSALIEAGQPHALPAIVESLKESARSKGLWNLFLPDSHDPAHGLSVTDYAVLAELTGWSPDIAPEVLNCSAPDTGNMEVLHLFGTDEQKKQWLEPLLAGEIRSGFAMTEPDVASSDARNIATSIVKEGNNYVINGRKWWTTGAMDPRCQILIVMGVTDPDADSNYRQSMVLVPMNTPGVSIVRNLSVFGYIDQHGHAEILFENVKVPVANLIGTQGSGFEIAQARLGPGRIHHCMRAIGMAERSLSLMIERAGERTTFGSLLSQQGVIQDWIANARIDIEQARLLVLKTAWLIDTVGAKAARKEIAAIKVVVPRMAQEIIDHAIQVHGGAGVSQDTPLAAMFAGIRTLRIVDGPDEVHLRDIARIELKNRHITK
ncbi:MAG: acyl-CoA dehydrogenase [Actinobacteria bacterium]|nr:acyl-CoA dehydrogenase [Actinomycetota bacterium]MSY36417.1 acyl-CoA dehydrogenase [Actinomycetota bacterium]MTA72709.1 acyl-CoA dehydrogenase [Actinomycetota bacterium]MTB29823.1 acyl-CoA dehydrogenase [Actinomycetota bacterium]MUH49249.1 acyl-CoA dehydrogenase [Actinomycetota bacterium]